MSSSVANDFDSRRGAERQSRGALERFIESECGAGCRVANLAAMEEGHAGLTFGFDIVNAAGQPLDFYVLKLAPAGVARRGNTDVYRQAPLLRALKAAGMPVPAVPWASPDGDALGTPFIVMERLPGRIFLVWEPHSSFPRDPTQVRASGFEAARMLARLHQVDWQTSLPDWEKPRPLSEELDFWMPLLRHAQHPRWLVAGTELHQPARPRIIPDAHPVGVVHGDFQPGNILYVDGRAEGLIDWELASIGSQGLDVGWLMMLSDRAAWHAGLPAGRTGIARRADRRLSRGRRAGACTTSIGIRPWRNFRLGAIACLNVKLHRTGKRTDVLWEWFAPSISTLFARGIELRAARQREKSHGG